MLIMIYNRGKGDEKGGGFVKNRYICIMIQMICRYIVEALRALADWLMPSWCPVCGDKLVKSSTGICVACKLRLPVIPRYGDMEDNSMARLFWGLVPVEKAQTIFEYRPGNEVSAIVEEMKYHGVYEIGIEMGRMSAQRLVGRGFFDGVDMIIPVPLTKSRKRWRGYNQAEMISNGLAEVTAIPVSTGNLVRKRFHGSQTRLSAVERGENVKNCFDVTRPEELRGKHVLLVDDVLTTGATLRECCMALADRVGDVRVSVFTLCRA